MKSLEELLLWLGVERDDATLFLKSLLNALCIAYPIMLANRHFFSLFFWAILVTKFYWRPQALLPPEWKVPLQTYAQHEAAFQVLRFLSHVPYNAQHVRAVNRRTWNDPEITRAWLYERASALRERAFKVRGMIVVYKVIRKDVAKFPLESCQVDAYQLSVRGYGDRRDVALGTSYRKTSPIFSFHDATENFHENDVLRREYEIFHLSYWRVANEELHIFFI